MREQRVNRNQRIAPKVQRPLAVVFGFALVVVALWLGSRGQWGGGDSAGRWVVFALLLAGVLAMTWTPASAAEDEDADESHEAHYSRSGR